VAWRYYFYLLVLRTIFYSLAAHVRKILVSPLEDKSHIFAPPCNILYIRTLKDITKYQWDIFCDVFTSADVDADSTDQNECWFVFCDCVVLLTDTWFYIFVHGPWWKQHFTHSLYNSPNMSEIHGQNEARNHVVPDHDINLRQNTDRSYLFYNVTDCRTIKAQSFFTFKYS
jgi:hypothetical protein